MKITKAQLRKIIEEEIQETRMGGLGGMLSGESPGFNPERVAGADPMDVPTLRGSVEDRLDSLEERFGGMASDLQWIRNKLSTPEGPLDEEEAKRTAKGNITQDTREKYATVGDDGFPIFDKKSAEAAIDTRGHASEEDQKKIINKAAKYAPAAAKKAREVEKKK